MSELIQIDSVTSAGLPGDVPAPVGNRRIPEWLTIKLPKRRDIDDVTNLMRSAKLHTVCEEARCPNLGECWSKKTATFMILGDICTRSCRFCAVKTGRAFFADGIGPDENPVLPGSEATEDFRLHRLRSGEAEVCLHTGERVGR